MTEVSNKEVVSPQTEVKDSEKGLLNWLEKNSQGREDVQKKLENNPELKGILKGVDPKVWKEVFKNAKPEERSELAVVFKHLNFKFNQLVFEKTQEEAELEKAIRKELGLLQDEVLEASKIEYNNRKNDQFGQEASEKLKVSKDIRSDEDLAIAALLVGQEADPQKQNEMLKFVKKIKDWNAMTNVLAHILSDKKYEGKTSFTEQYLKADPQIRALYGKSRFLVNETGRIVQLLNATSRESLQKIVDIKGRAGANVKEAYNAKKFLEVNQEVLDKEPFLLLSDLNMTGELDRKEKGKVNNHRWSEQQLYAAFLSNADTKNVPSSEMGLVASILVNLNIAGFDTSSNAIKQIVDGERTKDLISGFKLLLSGTKYPVNEIENNTLQEFSAFLKKYPEAIAVYHKELDKRSYNAGVDLSDLLTASQLKNLQNKKDIQQLSELNSIRDETKVWFDEQMASLPKDSEEREWFDSLDASGKLSTMRKIIDTVDKIPNVLLSLAGLSVTDANKISKKDLLQTAHFKINYLKDDAGIGPRFSMGFNISKLTKTFYHSDGSQIGQPLSETLKGFNPYIDIPLVNISGERDLNESVVKNANMNKVSSVKKLYGRLGANIHAYFKNPITGEVDKKFSGGFRAALEGAVGVKKDYKEALELQADSLGKVMLEVFKNPNFSDKDSFVKDIRNNLENLKKDNKSEFARYLKNNPEFDLFIVQDIADALDQIGVFGKEMELSKKQNAENLLHTLLKGTLEEIKNEKIQHLNGKTKLTRLGLFAQISAFLGGKREALGVNGELLKKNPGAHLALGLEASISSWKVLYAPDKEKILYMDESLHTGAEIQKETLKTNSSEAMVKSVKELLDRTNIQGLSVGMNSQNQLEIHIPENTLQKAGKSSARELFNIYLNPDQQKNIAVEKNKITIGNVKDLSLATRNYFDDFAVYLFVGGKGVDQCSTKVKEEKKSDTIEGFTFIPEQKEVKEEKKTMTFEYRGFDFDKMRKEVREVIQWVDNQPYNKKLAGQFLAQMNNGKVDEAIKTVSKMFDQYANRQTWAKKEFSQITTYLNDASKDSHEKIQTLNTLKALFAFTNVHNVPGLDINLKQRKEVFAGLDKNFPLDKKLAVEKRESLITTAKQNAQNGKITYEHAPNVVGYTAFYHKDNNEGRGYSLNALGNNHILGGADNVATIDDNEQKKQMTGWLQDKMKADSEGYTTILSQIRNNLAGVVDDPNAVSEEELKNLLWSDNGLDIQGKKITLEKKYLFYLLGECANESLGLQLGNILVEGRPAQEAKDQLNLGSDTQSLSKEQLLDEKKLNGKWNFFSTRLGQKEEIHNKEGSDPSANNSVVLSVSQVLPHNPVATGTNDANSVD